MNEIGQAALKLRFQNAIDQFIDKIRDDVNIIAIILGGSVAYDVIWEKSDVDLTVVVRDQQLKHDSLSVDEDGITFNIYIVSRSSFRRFIEHETGGSFLQSYLANGKIIYSTEDSFYEFFEDIKQIGEDDRAISALHLTSQLVSTMHKVQKWMNARKDLMYAQYFFLKLAETIANLELCIRGIPSSRSAIQKAIDLNPEIMRVFYSEPLSHLLTEEDLTNGLKLLEQYIEDKMSLFKKPVVEYLSDQQIKTVSMIAKRFGVDSHLIVDVLEFMSERGIIEKVTQLVKLTPKSRLSVEEIGYLYIP